LNQCPHHPQGLGTVYSLELNSSTLPQCQLKLTGKIDNPHLELRDEELELLVMLQKWNKHFSKKY
jgi:hypothetical protein